MMMLISLMIIKNSFKNMNKNLHNMLILIMFNMIMFNDIKMNLFNYMFNNYCIDNNSFMMVLLTLWIFSFSLLSNFNFFYNMNKIKFINLILFMMNSMIMFFMSMNLLMFFIYFESSLIPIIMLIFGWGNQIDRIQASMYMLIYTLFGSMPLLIMIIFLYKNMNSCLINFIYLLNKSLLINFNLLTFLAMNLAFLIKMPMYFLHLWLPKAHVESPISGSMILAGIMLKLGSFGMMRFIYMFMYMYNKFNLIFMIMSIWGSIMCCLICMNINDLKIIIAYSSIIHMGAMLTNLMIMFKYSFFSSIMMMFAHGLCSPLMFYTSFIMYKRSKSRNIYFNKGIINVLPNLSMWWFLITICNMSSPPSLNLISEFFIMMNLIKYSLYFIMINLLLIFFSSLYNIYFFYSTQNKMWNLMNFNFNQMNFKETLILKINWMILNLMFFNIYLMT
uniref:NADH dehydrogenase subunit 4 n=1 Tax=Chelonus formosanus TaxID=2739011 RepID=UPI001EDD1BDE|nr:NADH dehydrogenase subunit 4 [Chelonus formosanus]UHY94334.1 NADH dehydrogenase subunit 4 [Chelonus formosanus]